MKRQRQRRDLLAIPWVIAALFVSGAHGQCEVAQLFAQGGLGKVSLDGEIAILGDGQAFGSLGAAYVYRRGPGGPTDWQLESVLMSPEPNTEEAFGSRVAVSGQVIVMGAPAADTPEFQSGAAYVYRSDGSDWQFETKLTASDGDASDQFGVSVAIDGDVILIGAREDENDGVPKSGSAYVFRYNRQTSRWDEEAKLTDPNAQERDGLGQSVAIRGDVALIGAHGNDDAGSGTGAAFVFRYDRKGAGAWVLEQQLQAFDAQWQAWFGWSVSLADDTALIGAPQLDSQNGAAYVMRHDGQTWVHEAKLVASNPVGWGPWFGSSLSINGKADSLVIGAPIDSELAFEAGAAHVFRVDPDVPGRWQEVIKLFASNGGPGDHFGRPSVSQDIALIRGGELGDAKGYVFAGIQDLDCNENGEPDACDIFDGTSCDENGNGIPDECESIPGDINGDGVVNSVDLLILLVNWGPCENCDDCPADLDGNCVVGASDLLILLVNWG